MMPILVPSVDRETVKENETLHAFRDLQAVLRTNPHASNNRHAVPAIKLNDQLIVKISLMTVQCDPPDRPVSGSGVFKY